MDPFLPDADKVRALRDAIPGATAGIYLNTASAGPLPSEVDAAMRGVRDWELRVGRGDLAAAEASLGRRDEARGVLAALVGASIEEIVLTHGTLGGMAIAIGAIPLQAGDSVVATDDEHPGVDRLLEGLARRDVAVLRVGVRGSRSSDDIAAEFDRMLRSGARLAVLPHVTWATGRRLPAERVAQAARDAGAWSLVDGALTAAAVPVALASEAIDFYAFPGRKWLLAPGGTGALRLGPRVLAELTPPAPGGDRTEPAGEEGVLESRAGARGWEIGGWDEPVIAGLARAAGWLEMYVGLEWAQARTARLVRRLADLLASVPRVSLLAPPGGLGAIVAFRVEGWPAAAVAEELRRRRFAILAALPERDIVRLSVAAFNTDDEIDQIAETVTLVAKHEPGTLPRRASLVVLQAGS